MFKIKHVFIEIATEALEVVKWFNNHSRALSMLRAVQLSKHGKVLALILPVLTRWTSHYLAVTRLIETEVAFKQLLLDAGETLEPLIMCAGTRADAKRKARDIMSILQRPNFWPQLKM